MDIRTPLQIRKRIKSSDFSKLIIEHPTFLLHFYAEPEEGKMDTLFMSIERVQYMVKTYGYASHPMLEFLKTVNLPYFELPMKDASELMLDFGYTSEHIYDSEKLEFRRAMLVIHNGKVIHTTQENCYCIESVTEGILKVGPDHFLID